MKKQVGTDYLGFAIHEGDTVYDEAGRRYTADERGRAVTMGGKAIPLTDLVEPLVYYTKEAPRKPGRGRKRIYTNEELKAHARAYNHRYYAKNRERLIQYQRDYRARKRNNTPTL